MTEQTTNAIIGPHTWDIWAGALIWCLVGIALVKVYYYKPGTKFSFKVWLRENWKDVAVGFVLTMLLVRLGDPVIDLAAAQVSEWINVDISQMDTVASVTVIAMAVQWFLHKNLTKQPEKN